MLTHNFIKLLLFISFINFLFCCNEQKPQKTATFNSTTKTSTGTANMQSSSATQTNSSVANNIDVCKAIKAENDLSDFSDIIDEFCKQIALLRTSDYVYEGDTPKVVADPDGGKELPDNKSSMRVYTSMRAQTGAQSYFNMMKLQTTDPTKFEENFETDPYVKYEIISKDSNSVKYSYENNSDKDSIVSYKATSNFFTIEKNVLYVVSTGLTESKETVVNLSGLVIINKIDDHKIEVFSISDQVYENSGNHKATYTKAIKALTDEEERSYKNAGKADKANDLL